MKALEFVTFAVLRYGRMAERLRQRSAKPSTPVRIRFRPPSKGSVSLLVLRRFLFVFTLTPLWFGKQHLSPCVRGNVCWPRWFDEQPPLFSFLKRLTTPFEKTKAFKLGIIDKKGISAVLKDIRARGEKV